MQGEAPGGELGCAEQGAMLGSSQEAGGLSQEVVSTQALLVRAGTRILPKAWCRVS